MQYPAYATIDRWVEISGVSRTVTYQLLASRQLVARKLNARVLIDVPAGLAFIASLPAPTIKPNA